MPRLSAVDVFRKVPLDLSQSTRRGGLLSISVAVVIGVVLFCETWTYLEGETKTRVILDNNSESKLDINFDISFLELPCRFATVEIWDFLGNVKLDVSSDVRKTVITGHSGEEIQHEYLEKKKPATETIPDRPPEKVPQTPANVEQLDSSRYGSYLKEHDYTFVFYYVEWCMFCQMAKPVWESFAHHIPSVRPNVRVAQVDCMKEASLCQATKISGYPTFIMFKGVNPLKSNYEGDRSVKAFTDYVVKVSDTPKEEHPLRYQWHEGCRLSGLFQVNRVPGNFHVYAKSNAHNFNQKSTNTSHIVHHLSFGAQIPENLFSSVPNDVRENIAPLDELFFVNQHGHMSHEHYIKVISTRYKIGSLRVRREVMGYQMSTSNHQYRSDPNVPEARFSYDLSPTAVVISPAGRRWYEFITSLCAIIGGTFTTFSLMDGIINTFQRKLKSPLTPSSKLT